ncbi:MAG: hypothetical protein V7K31_12190 [Nostoc sp.]
MLCPYRVVYLPENGCNTVICSKLNLAILCNANASAYNANASAYNANASAYNANASAYNANASAYNANASAYNVNALAYNVNAICTASISPNTSIHELPLHLVFDA